jgi:hypothetical protein
MTNNVIYGGNVIYARQRHDEGAQRSSLVKFRATVPGQENSAGSKRSSIPTHSLSSMESMPRRLNEKYR